MTNRNQGRRQPIPDQSAPAQTPQFQTPAGQLFFGYDPSATLNSVDVESSKTGWSEFTLEDGAVIRIKGFLIDVKRAVDQYGIDGKPIYVMQMTLVQDLIVPDNLMKKS